jgi:hypothetical protein
MKTIFKRSVLLIDGLALALVSIALVDFILHPLAADFIFNSTIYRAVVILALIPLNLLVGFLIMRRVPGNVVGPLLIVFCGTVANWSIRPDIAPQLFAIFFWYDMAFGWLAFILMLIHFPNGEIYSPRLAPWFYGLAGIVVLVTSGLFLSTAVLPVPPHIVNPYHMPALANAGAWIDSGGILLMSVFLVLALVSPVLRFRNGSPRERQQIKWLALFGAVIILYTIPAIIIIPLLTGGEPMSPGYGPVAMFFYLISGLFPPLVIGIAIFRHHLWDIDILIRRTLVYSILTVILTLVYFGSIVVLQALFTRLFGHESPLAIVLSTLAIAAIFTQLRRRIQAFIDRRFYRQKYDAERVLTDFSLILRENVDLDQLTKSLLEVVVDTMQPDHVSIWLREVELRPGERPPKEN